MQTSSVKLTGKPSERATKGDRASFFEAESRRRLEMLEAIGDDRDKQKTVLAHSATYPLRWMHDWVWIHEPRARPPMPKWIPFSPWSCQEDLTKFIYRRYENEEAGGVKKSRDMGFSWTCAAIAVWFWLFQGGAAITFGSRTEDKVDSLDDPDALLAKCRVIIDALPPWMRPSGYDRDKHGTYMRIRNPETGAIIRGEIGDNMGRGGRSTIYFADEFGFVPRAQGVRGAIGGNADVVIYGSTSNGVGTVFHQMEASGEIPFFHLHWREHPHRDDAWKRQKVADIGQANFAREYDMKDGAALEELIIPSNWVMSAKSVQLPEDGLEAAGLDVGGRGPDDSAYARRSGPILKRIEAWDEPSTTKTARKAIEFAEEDGVEILRYDAVGVGAGVRSTLDEEAPQRVIPVPVVGGESPTRTVYDDAPDTRAEKRFKNLVTEIWWSLRQRFRKTHESLNGVKDYPEDEQIALEVDDEELISQFSSRQYHEVGGTKIKAQSKDDMDTSPDKADAAVYAFADAVKPSRVSFDQPAPQIR